MHREREKNVALAGLKRLRLVLGMLPDGSTKCRLVRGYEPGGKDSEYRCPKPSLAPPVMSLATPRFLGVQAPLPREMRSAKGVGPRSSGWSGPARGSSAEGRCSMGPSADLEAAHATWRCSSLLPLIRPFPTPLSLPIRITGAAFGPLEGVRLGDRLTKASNPSCILPYPLRSAA